MTVSESVICGFGFDGPSYHEALGSTALACGLAGRLTRRSALQAVAAGAGITAGTAAFLFRKPRPVAGRYVDRSHAVGHAIRDGRPVPATGARSRVPVAIVGGGIAGLSAAWRMRRLGFDDFVVLEMEDSPGGNSRSGGNEHTEYPWGAHYVPVPDRRIPLVEELFTELGVLRDGKWDSSHVCREPLGRLFLRGEWVPDIEPGGESSPSEREQFDRFWDRMDYFRHGGGFTIPIRGGRRAGELDRISMKSWMIEQGFFNARLRWYVDYACRDDYGGSYGQTSAWAGIHYFAARAEDDSALLTWPEGNGWIVKRLATELAPWLRKGTPVHRIAEAGPHIEVVTEEATYECDAVVFAAPAFLAPFLMPGLRDRLPSMSGFDYSPWYTANLVIDRLPREYGSSPAWENVIYDSPGLGYVVATHQTTGGSVAPTVWTYYRAMSGQTPQAARHSLLNTSWSDRKEEVLADLEQAHPDIRDCVQRLDIMRLGHAMIRPAPGFISSHARARLATMEGPVQFANSDLSGISIFEEAQYRGVRAAERVLSRLGYRNLDYADD